MPSKTDLLGQKFGRLLVVGETTERDFGVVVWACRCECGAFVAKSTNVLNRCAAKSCGCLRRDLRRTNNITHGGAFGKRKERLYTIWKGMRARCSNPKLQFSDRYVSRGITVCPEWEDYGAFREWALANGYSDNLSLDRIDNDGSYAPENCRWADNLTQANNTSRNVYVEVGGEKMTLAQAQRALGVPAKLYRKRRKLGWTEQEALAPPLATWSRHKTR